MATSLRMPPDMLAGDLGRVFGRGQPHELLIAPRDIEDEAGHEPTISHLLSLSAGRRSRPKPFWIDLPGVIGRTALSGEYRAN
mgnify:CR=1 FL=1